MSLSPIPLLTEAYFSGPKNKYPCGKMLQRHFQRHQCKSLVWCGSWSVGSLGRPARRGVHCENWHVDAFMPPSHCSQGAREECHNSFFSPSRACPRHTPGCRSQTAFPSCHLSLVLQSHAIVIQVTYCRSKLYSELVTRLTVLHWCHTNNSYFPLMLHVEDQIICQGGDCWHVSTVYLVKT